MIRETCGTLPGAIAHHAAGEPMCGWCLHAEKIARLTAEAIYEPMPRNPDTTSGQLLPVTAEQARENKRILAAEVADVDRRTNPHYYWRDKPPLQLVPKAS